MKILVVGANGMVGHVLSRTLADGGIDVVGTARGEHGGLVSLNLEDWDKFKHFILNNHFDIIFNCAGILVEGSAADKPAAVYINSLFPQLLAKLLQNSSTKVIHLSTGGVFSGGEDVFEDAPVTPPTFYGITKAAGEFDNGKDLVVRSDFWGPDRKRGGGGIFNWFLNQKSEVKAYENVYFNGVSNVEFAKIALKLADYSGILHIGTETISKAELLRKIKKRLKLDTALVSEHTTGKKIVLKSRFALPHIGNYDDMLEDIYSYLHANGELYREVYPLLF